jgi:hypothetical protein
VILSKHPVSSSISLRRYRIRTPALARFIAAFPHQRIQGTKLLHEHEFDISTVPEIVASHSAVVGVREQFSRTTPPWQILALNWAGAGNNDSPAQRRHNHKDHCIGRRDDPERPNGYTRDEVADSVHCGENAEACAAISLRKHGCRRCVVECFPNAHVEAGKSEDDCELGEGITGQHQPCRRNDGDAVANCQDPLFWKMIGQVSAYIAGSCIDDVVTDDLSLIILEVMTGVYPLFFRRK